MEKQVKVPTLTEEQNSWLTEKLGDREIIYVGIHGSWLYGLSRPESDIDVKAVYLPAKKDLIYGKALKTHNYKNDELEIELEVKSICEFLKSTKSCDTNCLDLLHAPEEFALYNTVMWSMLKDYRKGMYAKNMRGVVGYIKTHSKKYTNKIDRLNEMKSLLAFINFNQTESHLKADTVRGIATLLPEKSKYKYIKSVTLTKEGEQQYLEVCGKKYIYTWSVDELKTAMINEINRYGKRSNKGAEKGIDSKSLSHALRVLVQLKEILVTRDLKFPLQEAEYVKKVKLGEITNVKEVLNKIDELYEECMDLMENSDLPDDVDISGMESVVESYYFS